MSAPAQGMAEVAQRKGEGVHFMVDVTPGPGNLANGITRAIHCDVGGTLDITWSNGETSAAVVVIAGMDYYWHVKAITAAGGGAVVRAGY